MLVPSVDIKLLRKFYGVEQCGNMCFAFNRNPAKENGEGDATPAPATTPTKKEKSEKVCVLAKLHKVF